MVRVLSPKQGWFLAISPAHLYNGVPGTASQNLHWLPSLECHPILWSILPRLWLEKFNVLGVNAIRKYLGPPWRSSG